MIDIFFHDKTGVVSGFPGQIDGFEYADGNGEIHYYRLFDGVGIMLLGWKWRRTQKFGHRSGGWKSISA